MIIEDFVKKSMEQDNRNIFEETEVNEFLPSCIKDFYQKANPIDVEITMDGNTVRFIPADELEDTQSDYSIGNERFIFATCNGDPIYVYEGKIYTCCHGISKIDDELMAENFSSFLDLID